MPVLVPCPQCGFENSFWGYANEDGMVLEHFGRKCRGAEQDPVTMEIKRCGFRFRLKVCHSCSAENDVTASACEKCEAVLVDAERNLKQAKLSKGAHLLTPDRITFDQRQDKNGQPFLEVRYYDDDGQYVSEAQSMAVIASVLS